MRILDSKWRNVPQRVFTLAILTREGICKEVLLGMKKRGFGRGKWNGFGGKVEVSDVSIVAAAAREVYEETMIQVNEEDLLPHGTLYFTFEGSEGVMQMHVFATSKMRGEGVETEEMRPEWFEEKSIPYDEMWSDDRFWLPRVLCGECVDGHFHFACDEKTILYQNLRFFDRSENCSQ
uniref:Oxidized purine nucleoside triphosphate hydrolase n=1 Tax=Albugo laibachii Nc14 TaxID=890382 RepID=F0WLM6_9STRA|nr:conserved hypothetical protein [Albugo laibachii Nc14]|eukprot:CCA22192.1 conserved hypothetical protein [Albugo laibachii Nc14]